MSNISLDRHISAKFNHELEDIRNHILSMGGMVEQQIADVMQAAADCDVRLAEQVVAADHKINAMEVAIDENCIQTIALRQPAAVDLRLIMTVVKVITDLERMGDEAEGIANLIIHVSADKHGSSLLQELRHLGKLVRQMVHDALDAMARLDADAALEVARRDEEVDNEFKALTRQLITYMMEDPRTITNALNAMWSARALERIGDHACNICEYVIYLVKGKDVRHTDFEAISELLGAKD